MYWTGRTNGEAKNGLLKTLNLLKITTTKLSILELQKQN